MDKVASFRWTVKSAGYRKVDGDDASSAGYLLDYDAEIGNTLHEIPLEDGDEDRTEGLEFCSDTPRKYYPLEESGLFLQFAGVSSDPNELLAFANQFGLLGGPLSTTVERCDQNGKKQIALRESVEDWTTEIQHMRSLVELWKAIRASEVALIRKHLPVAWMLWQSEPTTAESLILRLDAIERAGTISELRDAADVSLKKAIERKLEGRLSFVFSLGGLVPQPDSLLGAIWIQFAQAVAKAKQYRQCEDCRKWFELSPQVARTNRVFCSTACRSRAYRKRQDKARELNGQGIALDQIAVILESQPDIVRGWIDGHAARPGQRQATA
jgi:hypothetical protein